MSGVVEHRHCRVCGRPISLEEETCSPECAQRRETSLRSRRRLIYVLWGLILIVLLVTAVRYGI